MSDDPLSERERRFVEAIVRNGDDNATLAAEEAGYAKIGAAVQGHRMLRRAKIQAAIANMRAPVVRAVQLTLESHLEKLAELRDAAKDKEQMSAAVAAEVARGKAAGLIVDLIRMKDPADQNDEELETAAVVARKKMKLVG